jgi:hypothetical protein
VTMKPRWVLWSAFSFLFSCTQMQAISSTGPDSVEECFGELFDYVDIDPISPKTVNDSFIVRAHVPEMAKQAIATDGKPLIIAIDIHPDPEGFSIIDSPLNILEEISTKEGGEWTWRLKAKEPGIHTIDFRIGYIKNNRLRDNCPKSITVNVNALPLYSRIGYLLYSNLGWLISNLITIVIAVIGWTKTFRRRA